MMVSNVRTVLAMMTAAMLCAPLANAQKVASAARASGDTTMVAAAPANAVSIRVGDEIALAVSGFPALSDTFTVRAGPSLQLPDLPVISLSGVSSDRLQGYMSEQIGRYLKDADVRVTLLRRVAVMGAVMHGGYYMLSSDTPLDAVVKQAGGLTGDASLEKSMVRRDGRTFLDERATHAALANGTTLGQLGIASGDEVVIGVQPKRTYEFPMRIAALMLGAAGIIVTARHGF